MELFKRLIIEENGQGLVEYTLIVLLWPWSFGSRLKTRKSGTNCQPVGEILRAALRIRTAAAQDPKGRESIAYPLARGRDYFSE